MDGKNIPRIVLAGTNSGVGKTTIVAGLLKAFTKQGKKVQPYKVGPDYIDPGFHKLASGRDCYNLDTWLVPQEKLVPFFVDTASDAELVIIEGVMGLYDGGREGVSSTAQIAKTLQAPVVLVIDCKAMGESAAAIAKGFKEYDKDINLAGVILNRIGSDNHERMIKEALERLQIPVIGVIRRDEKMHSPERHLGLTPVTEVDSTQVLTHVGEVISASVDLERFEKIAQTSPLLPNLEKKKENLFIRARIGVALDEAFSFYYPASLDALRAHGAEIVPFSPLKDETLPDVDGLFFGGGFPEMFVENLEKNKQMKQSIKAVAAEGMPIYAECGGLMYLCDKIVDFVGNDYKMVGLVPADCTMQDKLQKVGYVTATATMNTVLTKKGDALRGHEFHFSTMEPHNKDFPWAFQFQGGRVVKTYWGGYSKGNILASYLHLNFAGNDEAAELFISNCEAYRKGRS